MPPLPDVDQVVKVEFDFSIDEDLFARCRKFYQYDGATPVNADLDEFAEDILASVATNLCPLAGNHIHFTRVGCIDLTSPTAAIGESSSSHVGTRGTTLLTADICALQSLHVDRRYRGGHPRVYWPFGITSDLADQQTWTDAFVTAAEAGLASLQTDILAAAWAGATILNTVNVSYYQGFTVHTGTTGRARNVSTPRTTAVVDQVTSTKVRKGIAVQRNRLLHLA